MNPRELLDRALSALRDLDAGGDAFLEERQTLRLQVRDGVLDTISRAEVRGLAVRAMKDGRLGFVHTGRLEPDAVAEAARQAVELAGAASPRDDLALAGPSGPGDGRDEGEPFEIHDDSIATRSIEEKEDWIRRAEAAGRGVDPRVSRTESATYTEALGGAWLANTRGLYRHFRSTQVSVGLELAAEDGEDKETGAKQTNAVHWSDLPTPEAFGESAGNRALTLIGGRPVATGKFPVVFGRDVGWTLLVYISQALNGDAWSRGRSWLVDRPDARLGNDRVTIRDQGRMPGGLATAPFDGEGSDTSDNTLVSEGKVVGKILDLASGRRLGEPSTGNSGRNGYEALPAIQTRNLYLEPGALTPEEIVGSVDRGLWIWGVSGWWIGLDPSNPNFSSAVSGLWIEKGKAVKPVARVTVAGSLSDLLGAVDAIGNDLIWEGNTTTPTFRVSEMTVSGT